MADLAAAPAPERAALADDSEHHEHKEEDYGAVVKREPLCVVCTGSGKDQAGNVVYSMDVMRGGVAQVRVTHTCRFRKQAGDQFSSR